MPPITSLALRPAAIVSSAPAQRPMLSAAMRASGNLAYKVQPGDTVLALSRRFGTTPNVLTAMNPGVPAILTRDGQWALALRVGATINVPSSARGLRGVFEARRVQNGDPCTAGLSLDAQGRCVPDGTRVPTMGYRISPGDTLPIIARRLGVPTTAIIALNPALGQIRRSWGTDLKQLPRVGGFIRVPHRVIRRTASRLSEERFLGDYDDCCGIGYTRQSDGSCKNDFTGNVNWDCGGGPSENGGGADDCGPGQHLVQGNGYVGCASDLSGQPCGNGGTYDDYGACVGEAGQGATALQTLLANSVGSAAYEAAQSGEDPVAYANALTQTHADILCGLAGIASAIPVMGPYISAACVAAQAELGGGGNASSYPQPCGVSGSGFYVFEPGGSCMFGGAGDACFPEGSTVPSMFDTQGNCVPKPSAQAGSSCATPNGFQGRAGSDGVCLVDGCPSGKKPNDLATDCIDGAAPGSTPAGGNPGAGPVKPSPTPGGGVVPVDKPSSGGKAEESNTGLYIAAAAAAAAAIGLGVYQSKKKGKKAPAKKR